jgi:hypothetical protein
MSLYAVTDQELLNEIQYVLVESPNNGASMTTTIWTTAEIIQYLNDRQRQLLRETGVVLKTGTVTGSAGVRRHELPEDCITLRRVAWHRPNGVIKELIRTDPFAADNMSMGWGNTFGTPQIYYESTTPNQVFEVSPTPNDAGYFHILYISTETDLSNSGVRCSIPDEFTAYVKYGVLADCWKKAGPGQDLIRAAYCEERFQEGIDLGRALMLHGGANV